MTSRLDRLEYKGARPRFTLPDASIVLCGFAMFLATLLTQPFAAGNPARAADAPAAGASADVSRAAKTIDQDAIDTVEHTVFRPELYVPVTGNLSVTHEQQ